MNTTNKTPYPTPDGSEVEPLPGRDGLGLVLAFLATAAVVALTVAHGGAAGLLIGLAAAAAAVAAAALNP